MIILRQASKNDLTAATSLLTLLFPSHPAEEMRAEMETMLTMATAAVFLAFEGELPVGFAECQLRQDYVEGTATSPVGYLEGIYVLEEQRRQGVARHLLACCEQWAKSQGCSEFASDCELDNAKSLEFHLKTGFEEANRLICFKKSI